MSKYKLQRKPCKHCGYQEYTDEEVRNGSPLSKYYTVEKISREPITSIPCYQCEEPMQLHYQEHHRRFYKCWKCNLSDADKKYYESDQFAGLEQH